MLPRQQVELETVAARLNAVLGGTAPLPTPKELNQLSKRLVAAIKAGKGNGQGQGQKIR